MPNNNPIFSSSVAASFKYAPGTARTIWSKWGTEACNRVGEFAQEKEGKFGERLQACCRR